MDYEARIVEEFTKETRRRLGENVIRLEKCLSILSEEEIWHRPNKNTVSVGNLILHLAGNLRQWMLSGLGEAPDNRMRQTEFDESGPIPTTELLSNLKEVLTEVDSLLNKLNGAQLIQKRKVQGFDEAGLSIIIHVVEHFSYHVGQITYITKVNKDVDLKYYGTADLNQTGSQSI